MHALTVRPMLLALMATAAAGPLAAQSKPVAPTVAPRAAVALLTEAEKLATKEHKAVLIKFSASWCGPCQAFDKFLKDTTGVGQIMRANFEIVGLTVLETEDKKSLENPGGVELSKTLGNDVSKTGIPFFYILDGTGKKLGDSNVMPDKSNIGYPEAIVEVAGFDDLLRRTRPEITSAERGKIKAWLDRAAGRVIKP